MAGLSLGDLFGTNDTEAQGYLQQALQDYQNIQTPSIASETVSNLPQETVQGVVNPNQIQVANQAPSAFNNISLDPATRQAQINAMNQYQDIANQGGLDANSKLALQQTIDAANEQSQGAQGAIQAQAQAQGQGNNAFDLTQRAISAQGASNSAATQGLETAAMAEANRQQALGNLANVGSNIEASDYGQAANTAAAQNSINAANQEFQNAANTQNVANNANAQQFNVQNAQGVNAANVAANQANAYYNAGLPQQQFNNELQKASGMAGVNQSQAGVAQQSQQNASNATGQLLKGGFTLGATALGGPIAGAIANGMGTPSSTNSQIAGTNAYQQNMNANNPNRISAGNMHLPGAQPQQLSEGGMCYAEGGMPHNHYLCMLMGGKVPGEAKVAGNSKQNDTQPALLSPGELVIPREVPKNGPAMERFAKNAPVGGDKSKRVDMTEFTRGYKRKGK